MPEFVPMPDFVLKWDALRFDKPPARQNESIGGEDKSVKDVVGSTGDPVPPSFFAQPIRARVYCERRN
jgi:hypothetical protein